MIIHNAWSLKIQNHSAILYNKLYKISFEKVSVFCFCFFERVVAKKAFSRSYCLPLKA